MKSSWNLHKLFTSVFIGACAASCLLAQSHYGELRLSLTDATGVNIDGSAELRNDANKLRQHVEIPATGHYTFRALAPGRYTLAIERSGFAPDTELVDIHSGLPVSKTVALSVAPIESRVEVSETATLVQPDRTGSTYSIGAQDFQERSSAMQAGRGLVNMIAAQPGWTLEANGILHPRESEYDTQFVVNGIPQYDNRSPAFAPPVETDGIESVDAITGGIPAEFGGKLGGVVEVNTRRNTSNGFHGSAVAQGGSFATAGGFLSGQYVAGRTTVSATAQGFLTDRFLDPATTANDNNHASNGAFTASVERDFGDADHLRIWAARRETRFGVPNDFLQQDAGQRQDRTTGNTEGAISYQHVFSPAIVGALRGTVRDVNASLWSNPLATPVLAAQDRHFREGYVNGSLEGQWRAHNWKTGVEARWSSINEQFAYQILQYSFSDIPLFDTALPPVQSFRQHGFDREQAAYAQDSIRWHDFTFNVGLRFDHYSLLVKDSGWSPRLSASWAHPQTGTVLHVAYDRTFGTPPIENLLVSSVASPQLNLGLYLPISPSRGNYYEGGVTQAFGQHVRLDATYFLRDINNLFDDDVLLNTGVSFPITFHNGRIRGTEVKVSVPDWGRWSGYLSYSNSLGRAQFPISGGLFLDQGAPDLINSNGRFPISQDQRNVAAGMVHFRATRRLWTAASASYNSGLPIEGELPETDFLVAEYGANVLASTNPARGRVRPNFSLNASLGADLWHHENVKVTGQADAMNLTNRLNVINFAGLLSGTAIAQPLSFGVRLRVDF